MSIKNYDRDYAKRLYKDVNSGWLRSHRPPLTRWCSVELEYDGKVGILYWKGVLHHGMFWATGFCRKGKARKGVNRANRRKTRHLIHKEHWDDMPNATTPVFDKDIRNWD